jgi:glycosyltransferase involved in cell wall biosynthesis
MVSVILPTHNRADILSRAIKSALEQSYEDIELIIVDDFSTDETKSVIETFKDARIRYVRLDRVSGGSAARNVGIDLSRGEFIAFLDDDDEWLPEKIEKQMEKFKQGAQDLGLIYTGAIIITPDIKEEIVTPKIGGHIYKKQLKEDNIHSTSTWLVKKECFLNPYVGKFDETLPARQDYDLSLRLSKYYSVGYCSEPLVRIYRDRIDSISNDVSNRVKGHLLVLKKIEREISNLDVLNKNIILSSHYFSIGKYYQLKNEIHNSKRYLLKALKKWPFNLKAGVFYLLLLIGDKNIKLFKTYMKIRKLIYVAIKRISKLNTGKEKFVSYKNKDRYK